MKKRWMVRSPSSRDRRIRFGCVDMMPSASVRLAMYSAEISLEDMPSTRSMWIKASFPASLTRWTSSRMFRMVP